MLPSSLVFGPDHVRVDQADSAASLWYISHNASSDP